MSGNKELIDKFKEGMALEKGMINSMNQTVKKVQNVVVKQLLNGIALDSEKHYDIYSSLVEILSGVTALSEEERESVDAAIRNHIEVERKMIEFVKGLVDRTEDEKVKFLLKYVAADEFRHHNTLKAIMDEVVVKETISNEEWEDLLYKDAVAHGTPLG